MEYLQLLNVALTSGCLLALLKIAYSYGRMEQKVDNHEKRLDSIEGRI